MKLCEIIQNFRNEHSLSQRQFAALCDVSNGYVSMLERSINPGTGQTITPTLPSLRKIATGMGLTINELFSMAEDIQVDLNTDTASKTEDGVKEIKEGIVMSKFSDRFKALRAESGFSQEELARQIHFTKSSVNMYERGDREPSFERLEVIADFFNVDMDFLLGVSDVRNRYRDPECAPEQKNLAPEIRSERDEEAIKLYLDLPPQHKACAASYIRHLALVSGKYQIAAARGRSHILIPLIDSLDLLPEESDHSDL